MKTLFLLGALVLMLSSCSEEDEAPRIAVEIYERWQEHFKGDVWGDYVVVKYTLSNIGPVRFDYYYLWFWVTCTDDKTYEGMVEGHGLDPGMQSQASAIVPVENKHYKRVRLVRYRLYNWSMNEVWDWWEDEYRGES